MIWLRSLIWLTNALREINKCARSQHATRFFVNNLQKGVLPLSIFGIKMRISSAAATASLASQCKSARLTRVPIQHVSLTHTGRKVIRAISEALAKNVFSHFKPPAASFESNILVQCHLAVAAIVSKSLSREPTLSFCPSFLASELMIFLIKRDAASTAVAAWDIFFCLSRAAPSSIRTTRGRQTSFRER